MHVFLFILDNKLKEFWMSFLSLVVLWLDICNPFSRRFLNFPSIQIKKNLCPEYLLTHLKDYCSFSLPIRTLNYEYIYMTCTFKFFVRVWKNLPLTIFSLCFIHQSIKQYVSMYGKQALVVLISTRDILHTMV